MERVAPVEDDALPQPTEPTSGTKTVDGKYAPPAAAEEVVAPPAAKAPAAE